LFHINKFGTIRGGGVGSAPGKKVSSLKALNPEDEQDGTAVAEIQK